MMNLPYIIALCEVIPYYVKYCIKKIEAFTNN